MGLPMDDRRNSDSKTTRPAKLESRTGGKGSLIEGVLDPVINRSVSQSLRA